jgi:hypothetical protein
MLSRRLSSTNSPRRRHGIGPLSAFGQQAQGLGVEVHAAHVALAPHLGRCQLQGHQFGHAVLAVAAHSARNALEHGQQFAVMQRQTVPEALHVALDQHVRRRGLCGREGLAHAVVADQVGRDTQPLVLVRRFHHHRPAQAVRQCHRVVGGLHAVVDGARHADGQQQAGGEPLVLRQLQPQARCLVGHGAFQQTRPGAGAQAQQLARQGPDAQPHAIGRQQQMQLVVAGLGFGPDAVQQLAQAVFDRYRRCGCAGQCLCQRSFEPAHRREVGVRRAAWQGHLEHLVALGVGCGQRAQMQVRTDGQARMALDFAHPPEEAAHQRLAACAFGGRQLGDGHHARQQVVQRRQERARSRRPRRRPPAPTARRARSPRPPAAVGHRFVGRQEARQDVARRARRPAVGEGHEDHLVAAERAAVPRAVLADGHAVDSGETRGSVPAGIQHRPSDAVWPPSA